MHLKDLTNKLISEKIDIVVADISFISLTKLIDKLVVLFFYRYKCIFLIKPEFELQPNEISNGKVKSQKLLNKAINKIENYAVNHNFKIIGLISSPILGNKAGNLEYLIYLEKQ
jgi:23S rRNA (cytidine1920-2'-O)/16S rRNA (cytidine1409-2'-O)-methyltransferase